MIPVVLSTVVAALVGFALWIIGDALGAGIDLGLTVALSAGVTLVVNLTLRAMRAHRGWP